MRDRVYKTLGSSIIYKKITPFEITISGWNNQLLEPTNQNSIKVPKVFRRTNKKTVLLNFGDKCNKQSIASLPPGTKILYIRVNPLDVLIA